MARQVNKAALDIIRSSEGFSATAYVCPAGVLTIGYGHTGRDVSQGQRITKERADEILRRDVATAASTVERLTAGVPVNDNEFGAMVSLCFNIGGTAFAGSTLLRHVNCGRYSQAADEFAKWCHAGGRTLPGLQARRAEERALFVTPVAGALDK